MEKGLAESSSKRGFSLLEMMIVISVLGILSALAVSFSGNLNTNVQHKKLEQDVKSINSGIKIYIDNGGDLSSLSDPQTILDKMKSERSDATKASFVGLTGSTIDTRLAVRMADEENSDFVAVWNPSNQQFEIKEGTQDGVAQFYLDEALAEVEYKSAERNDSILTYNTKPGWIWAYEDKSAAPPSGPTTVSLTSIPDTNLPPPPRQLTPPTFSIESGSFPEKDFPLSVSLNNPNDPSTWIMYSIDGGGFVKYSAPITITDTSSIIAYAIGDPASWIRSNDSFAGYTAEPLPPPVQLLPPNISMSDSTFNESTTEIIVSISNPNDSGSSTLYYSLVANGDSHGDRSSWKPYTGTITATSGTYPSGFQVVSYAKSNDTDSFLDSDTVMAETTAEFFTIPITGDVLFIVDASSSMAQAFGTSTRFDVTIAELSKAIEALPSNLQFNVGMFDNGIRWTDGSFELKPATPSFKSTITSQIATVTTGGGTNYSAALELATMFTPAPKQIILLSDGQPNNQSYIDYVNQLAAEGIRVDTIGLDIGGNTAAVLGEIADLTNGILHLVTE